MLDHDIQEELSVNQCTSEKFCAEVFLLSAYRLLGTNDIRLNVPPERGAAFQERLVSCHYSVRAPNARSHRTPAPSLEAHHSDEATEPRTIVSTTKIFGGVLYRHMRLSSSIYIIYIR
jgi:hypothetical protein